MGPLPLQVDKVGSVLARRLALNQPVGLIKPLLIKILVILLGKERGRILVRESANAACLLSEAVLRHTRELHQTWVGCQALVLGEVVEVGGGLLLCLVELVVQLADVFVQAQLTLAAAYVGQLSRALCNLRAMTSLQAHARKAGESSLLVGK